MNRDSKISGGGPSLIRKPSTPEEQEWIIWLQQLNTELRKKSKFVDGVR
jgi:hypothetical protein